MGFMSFIEAHLIDKKEEYAGFFQEKGGDFSKELCCRPCCILMWTSVSHHGGSGVWFSMLIYYNERIMRLGSLRGEISIHVPSSRSSAGSKL